MADNPAATNHQKDAAMFKPIYTALTPAALATALAAALTFASSAAAETVRLSYGDLDLASAAGQQELSRRIETAARRACAVDAPTGTRIVPTHGRDACMADVRRQAETRLAAKTSGERRGR